MAKMVYQYQMVLSVPESAVASVLGAVLGQGVTLVRCEPMEQTETPEQPVVRKSNGREGSSPDRFAGGVRFKKYPGELLILKTLLEEGGPTNSVEKVRLAAVFNRHQFADGTVQTATNSLMRAGTIRSVGSKFQLMTSADTPELRVRVKEQVAKCDLSWERRHG